MDSRQGQLLLSTTDMIDPNFHQTVTLIVQHDSLGALGLTLNRPLDVSFNEAWSKVAQTPSNYPGHLYLGGPCEGPLMILHDNPTYAQHTVMEGVYFSTEPEDVTFLVEHHKGHMKCFASYAGWAPMQLEAELEVGSWTTVPSTPKIIFDPDPSNQWLDILKIINPAQATIIKNPNLMKNDPFMN